MKAAALQSIQVGLPQTRTDSQGVWETAFFKEPVSGTVFLASLGLEGDGVANTKFHGGPEQAVLLYSADHYPVWAAELGIDLPFGAFAENLTIKGLDETMVKIGDTFQVGDARLQVTKPRIPCGKISRRWELPDLTRHVTQTKRTGWYCRVLQEGTLEAGLPVELLSRSAGPAQTVAQAFQTYLSER